MTYRELMIHISLMSEEDKDFEITILDAEGTAFMDINFIHRTENDIPYIEVS